MSTDVVVADSFDTELFADLLAGVPGLAGMVEDLNARFDFTGDLLRDVLLALWQASPRLRGLEEMEPRHRRNQLVVSTLLPLPATQELRRLTVHDPYAAALAVLGMRTTLVRLLEMDMDDPPPIRSLLRVAVNQGTDAATAEGELFALWGVDRAALRRLSFTERAAMSARFSTKKIAEFLDVLNRLDLGPTPGKPSLRGREETWEVELSDRLADVLPSEYARLSHRALRLDFYRQLAEGTLLTRTYRGPSPSRSAPLVIALDSSASMDRKDHGSASRELWAKGFVMALLAAARRTSRPVTVILFADTGNQLIFDFTRATPLAELVAMVETSLGGGTDIADALNLALDLLRDTNSARADLVFVSDGDCALTRKELAALLIRRDAPNITVHGVRVGVADSPAMCAFSTTLQSVFAFADGPDGNTVRAGQTPVETFNPSSVSDSLFTILPVEAKR